MKNTTGNEPRSYTFIHAFDEYESIINDVNSFKDAIYKLYELEGTCSLKMVDKFRKALEGFSDNDVEGIISLFYRYTRCRISAISDTVYLIDDNIYG